MYSIFVSRVDVYTEQHVPQLSPAAQGQVGIVGAKRIWAENQKFWSDKKLPLDQEIIFASTGTKKPEDPPWKYVAAFAGSDIETNPPATNDAIEKSGLTFQREVDKLPPAEVLAEIDRDGERRAPGSDADVRRHQEVRRSAEGTARASRSQAGGAGRSASGLTALMKFVVPLWFYPRRGTGVLPVLKSTVHWQDASATPFLDSGVTASAIARLRLPSRCASRVFFAARRDTRAGFAIRRAGRACVDDRRRSCRTR